MNDKINQRKLKRKKNFFFQIISIERLVGFLIVLFVILLIINIRKLIIHSTENNILQLQTIEEVMEEFSCWLEENNESSLDINIKVLEKQVSDFVGSKLNECQIEKIIDYKDLSFFGEGFSLSNRLMFPRSSIEWEKVDEYLSRIFSIKNSIFVNLYQYFFFETNYQNHGKFSEEETLSEMSPKKKLLLEVILARIYLSNLEFLILSLRHRSCEELLINISIEENGKPGRENDYQILSLKSQLNNLQLKKKQLVRQKESSLRKKIEYWKKNTLVRELNFFGSMLFSSNEQMINYLTFFLNNPKKRSFTPFCVFFYPIIQSTVDLIEYQLRTYQINYRTKIKMLLTLANLELNIITFKWRFIDHYTDNIMDNLRANFFKQEISVNSLNSKKREI